MDARISAGLSQAECRRFGLVVGAAFLVLAGVLAWRGHETAAWATAVPGVLLILGGLLAPLALRPVHRAWMGLALLLSRVTTPIVMALLYFLVLTPFGLAMRLVGHNPLVRATGDSYWVTRPPERRRSNLTRPF